MKRWTVLRAVDRPVRTWKNGGGKTAEIAVFPAGATLEDFEWRISIASVTVEGPFSHFGGVERIIAIISGRLDLRFEAEAKVVRLGPDSEPQEFSGDAQITGTPLEGCAVDLNLMVRRGRWSGTMERISAASTVRVKAASECAIAVFAGTGSARWRNNSAALQRFDALWIEGDRDENLELCSQSPIYVVRLFPGGREID